MNTDERRCFYSGFVCSFLGCYSNSIDHNSATGTCEPGKSSGSEIISPSLKTTFQGRCRQMNTDERR